MELKFKSEARNWITIDSFNRTFMELKLEKDWDSPLQDTF